MSHWKEHAKSVRTMPPGSVAAFLVGVACIFAGIGSINDSFRIEYSTTSAFVRSVLLSGLVGVGWAWFISRRMIKSLIAFAIGQFALYAFLGNLPQTARSLTAQQWRSAVTAHGLTALILVDAGYICFISFFGMESRRYFAVQTEIELASAIQRKLVPKIESRIGSFEFYGISQSSGSVGGDLIDLFAKEDRVYAYLADVAGHGVPAGVLMSMVKTAVRTYLSNTGTDSENLLPALNDVLTPMTDAAAYATFAYLETTEGGPVRFSTAGHPPIFHFQRNSGQILRHAVENVPLAMFAGAKFANASIECAPGDIFAVATDGLTEVFDKKDRELGSGYLEEILRADASKPLGDIARQVFEASRAFGRITDDRTLLLIRRS